MFNKKPKKTSEPFTGPLSRLPTDITAGPLESRAAPDVGPKGEKKSSYRELYGDRPDPTTILDGDGPEPPGMVFGERGGGAQEPPETSTAVAIDDIEQGVRPTGECYRSQPSQPVFILISVRLPVSRNHWPNNAGR